MPLDAVCPPRILDVSSSKEPCGTGDHQPWVAQLESGSQGSLCSVAQRIIACLDEVTDGLDAFVVASAAATSKLTPPERDGRRSTRHRKAPMKLADRFLQRKMRCGVVDTSVCSHVHEHNTRALQSEGKGWRSTWRWADGQNRHLRRQKVHNGP